MDKEDRYYKVIEETEVGNQSKYLFWIMLSWLFLGLLYNLIHMLRYGYFKFVYFLWITFFSYIIFIFINLINWLTGRKVYFKKLRC